MEYDNPAFDLNAVARQQRAGSMLGGDVARTDFAMIRERLSDCVRRANDLGNVAHTLADGIVGTRPEPAMTGNGYGSASVAPSLVALVNELEAAVTRIETGFNRL